MDTSQAARKRLSPEDRRKELLQFGREFFAKHAFDAVSMNEIALMAGVSKGLLYHYFGGRRGFYLATVRHAVDGLLEAMAVASSDGNFVSTVDAFASYVWNNAGIYKTLIRGGLGADDEVHVETERVRRYIVERALAEGGLDQPTPLQRIGIVGWVASAEVAAGEWVSEPSVPRAEFIKLVVGNLFSTLDQLRNEVS